MAGGTMVGAAAGISDFRGPRGIWTLRQQAEKGGERKKEPSVPPPAAVAKHRDAGSSGANEGRGDAADGHACRACAPPSKRAKETPRDTTPLLVSAKPTFTHRALAQLVNSGKVSCVITQNVDPLLQRAGVPRDKLSVLHGCVCEEVCELCRRRYLRDFDVGTISLQKTGRVCTATGCGGDLRDTLLDWEDELPEDDLALAERECTGADLVISLGTSLRIEPAGSLPLMCKGSFVIVNLQPTPKDAAATLVVHARADDVMRAIAEELGESVPTGPTPA